jgi:hypothetical protein
MRSESRHCVKVGDILREATWIVGFSSDPCDYAIPQQADAVASRTMITDRGARNVSVKAGLVDGKGFAVDASLIAADDNECGSTPGGAWSAALEASKHGAIDPATAQRVVKDYLATLDDR